MHRTNDYLCAVLYSCVFRIISPGGALVSAALLQHQEERGEERGERRQEELDEKTGEEELDEKTGEEELDEKTGEEELSSSPGTGPVAAVTR